MENNKNKCPKHKLKPLKYKHKATPSKVKYNKYIGSNISVAPIIVTKKTYLYIVGKKAVNTAVPKV